MPPLPLPPSSALPLPPVRLCLFALAALAGCTNAVKVGDDTAAVHSGCELTLAEYNDDAAFDPTGWTHRVTYAYDDAGRMLTAQDVANVGEGTVQSTSTWTYPDGAGPGEPDTQEYLALDGTDLWTYTWNADGEPLVQSIDEGADGLVNYVTTWTYTDKAGVSTLEYVNDRGLDETPSSLTTYAYNASLQLAAEENDLYIDGTVDTRWTYTYDVQGNRALAEWDGGADGTVNETIAYTYDGHGNVLTAEDDKHADGTVDVTTTYTWDADGHQLTQQLSDADGVLTESDTWSYDADGNLVGQTSDTDGPDGTIDATAAFTWACP